MSFGVSIGDIIKVCEIATRVYKNCRDSPGEYKALTGEARSLTNLLQDVADKIESQSIPESKNQQLLDTFETCVDILSELDKTLKHYNSLDSKSKRAWDRLKWDSDTSRLLREKLTSAVTLLNSFYISLIHDNQVIILEALGRLEQDYRGGHREESLASVELLASSTANRDDDDAAWPQIIRDLEDVGISSADALHYRDFIIDWFVRAVNEGRLSEHSRQDNNCHTSTGSLDEARGTPPSSSPSLSPAFENPHSPTPPFNTAISSSLRSSEGLQSWPTQPSGQEDLQPSSWDYLDSPLQSATSATEFTQIEQHEVDSDAFLSENADRIAIAWNKKDYVMAKELLRSQVAAVERGETVSIAGRSARPNSRILKYLMGVCASLSGNFQNAKPLFETTIMQNDLKGATTHDGDIAAARWLGDVCLHINQPHNTALAWAFALEGLIQNRGQESDVPGELHTDIEYLVHQLHHLELLRLTEDNNNSIDIFASARPQEKLRLLDFVRTYLDRTPLFLRTVWRRGGSLSFPLEILSSPLESWQAWPLPWDPTYLTKDAITLQLNIRNPMFVYAGGFPPSVVPSMGLVALGQSRTLDHITKRHPKWLVDIMQDALRQRGIKHGLQGCSILCHVPQWKDGLAFVEGIEIEFWKLRFRDMFGVRVSPVRYATRGESPRKSSLLPTMYIGRDTDQFRDWIKAVLEEKEREAKLNDTKIKQQRKDRDMEFERSQKINKRVRRRIRREKASWNW
ncbi:hypothetical protein BDV96DRAFT_640845 [Lophiotrema nucula]|uniref:Fungal N-terminal domain-containing protein n=1 Tax=Lophiotrema nucula TaxID=690887 RepID=A0A6A5ZRF8_9PLEO|nr:hypothetical protein BDV96DRAFT_640845 [Lophiotrema nucula]